MYILCSRNSARLLANFSPILNKLAKQNSDPYSEFKESYFKTFAQALISRRPQVQVFYNNFLSSDLILCATFLAAPFSIQAEFLV